MPLSLLDQVRTGIATLDQSDHNVPDVLSSGTSRATRNWNTARSHGPGKRSVCSTDSPDAPSNRSAPDGTIESSTLLEKVGVTADGLLPDSIPASEWQGRPGHSFSREQSFAQVARENQREKDIPFHTWTVGPGQWGGRLPLENVGPITPLEQTLVTRLQPLLQVWLDSSESSLFSQHPPDSLMSAVQDILLCENAQHATEHILHHSDSAFVQSLPKSTVGIHSIPTTLELDKASEWSIGPPAEWLTAPLVSRPKLGQTLLSHAMSSIREGTTTTLQTPYNNDTWSCPFNDGYLNVGRRHLVGSLAEVVVLVLHYRPDILFLGDLVTSRALIGRLKMQIESNLKDERFMITNINASDCILR